MVQLTRRQWYIVRECSRGVEVRNADVRRVWPVTAETVRQDLASLVELGILQRHGAARGARYTLGDVSQLRESQNGGITERPMTERV